MPFRPSAAYLGLGKETTPGTAVAPAVFIPFDVTSLSGMEDIITALRDESARANDAVLQAHLQGTKHTEPGWNGNAYPEVLPYLLRGIVGADTVSGAGPYTHTFQQGLTQPPSWSLTDWDQVQPRIVPGFILAELTINIDAAGIVTYSAKGVGYPSGSYQTVIGSAAPAYSGTVSDPDLGWAVTCAIGGSAVDRVLTAQISLKRDVEAVFTAQGSQSPRQVFAGPLDVTGNVKVLYENQSLDYADYLANTQNVVQLNLASGAQTASLRMSKAARPVASKDRGGKWLQLTIDLAAVRNATDVGALLATVVNSVSAAY